MDRAAVRAAVGPPSGRLLVLDPTAELALDLLIAGHRVALLPGPEPALAALKLAAVRHLPVQSARATLGLDAPGRRIWFLHHLRPHLRPDEQVWWDAREDQARAGILGMGVVEAALATGRTAVRLLVPEAGDLEALVADPAAQVEVGRRLSGRRGLALAARLASALDPRPDGGVRALRDRLAAPLRDGRLAESIDHQWLLAGRWAGPEGGPAWLTRAGFAAAQAELDGLEVVPGPWEDALAQVGGESEGDSVVVGAGPERAAAGWVDRVRPRARRIYCGGGAEAATLDLLHGPPHRLDGGP